MGSDIEKPLLQIDGVSMIQLLVEAIRGSRSVDCILVAATPASPRTADRARELGVEVGETPGEGYENDMKIAIKRRSLRGVLVVSADLPFMSGRMVDHAIEAYKSSGKPALSVMSPTSVFRRLNIEPSHVFNMDGRDLVPIGLNVIDGTKIDEPFLEEAVLVIESEDLAVNVNTPHDLEVARKLAKERNLLGQRSHRK